MCGVKIHNRLNPRIKLDRDLIPFYVHGHRYHDFFFLGFGFGDENGQGGEAIVGDPQHAIVCYQHAVFCAEKRDKARVRFPHIAFHSSPTVLNNVVYVPLAC